MSYSFLEEFNASLKKQRDGTSDRFSISATLKQLEDEVNVDTQGDSDETIIINGKEVTDLDKTEPSPSTTEVTIDIGERAQAIRLVANECASGLRSAAVQLSTGANIAGNEGLYTGVRNMLFSVLDVLSHAGNDIYALAHSWRDFKQSELTQFRAAHRTTLSNMYSGNYYEIRDLEVDVPQGMIKPYYFTVTNLGSFLSEAQMPKRLKAMEECLRSILSELQTKRNSDQVTTTNALNICVKPYTVQYEPHKLTRIFDAYQACFKANPRDFSGQPFQKVFTTMSDLKNTVERVIDMDDYFREVAGCAEKVRKLEDIAGVLTTASESLDKKALNMLADFIQTFGESVTEYAVGCNDLNRIQHNLVHVLRTVTRELGYGDI